jgi:hypothetical protein
LPVKTLELVQANLVVAGSLIHVVLSTKTFNEENKLKFKLLQIKECHRVLPGDNFMFMKN